MVELLPGIEKQLLKIKIMRILIGLFILLGVACNDVNSQTSGTIEKLPPNEYQKRLVDKNIQFIDIRTPEEYKEGYITGAKNINYYDADFKDQMSKLNKNEPVYIYCRSGGRSGKAANILSEMGFKKVVDLQGGINSWNNSNLKLER